MTETPVGEGPSIQDVLMRAQDAVPVTRVYGEPFERDGALILPAAAVRGGGGGGGGGGSDAAGAIGQGEGVGFGIDARPVGVFIFKEGDARWKPAIDLTRILIWGNLVAIAYFFTVWRVQKAKAKAQQRG